jgi:uroporphyrin-3 C-methyltransferase
VKDAASSTSESPAISSSDSPAEPVATPPARRGSFARWVVVLVVAALAVASLVLAWRVDQRVQTVEQELVRRQQESAGQSAEARLLAKQAQEAARDAQAKVALLDARVAEVAVQRSQLEDLMQSVSRARDENLLVDIDASIRTAQRQSSITGSAEPLVAALKQSDDRLARADQPRLEPVRRAIARDLERVKAANVADVASLTIKLDEVVRMADELPLLNAVPSRVERQRGPARAASAARSVPAGTASAASSAAPNGVAGWARDAGAVWSDYAGRAWDEIKSLIRVTRIDHPETMLLAPDQAFFVRENLKLRLLNARLALLSRQFDTAQLDLKTAQNALERYFDRASRRTQLAIELVKQVAAQAHQVGVPAPADTLAALAVATAGR